MVIAISIGAVLAQATFAHTEPPQTALRTYPLHNDSNAADISPDDKLVATESTLQTESTEPHTKVFAEVVQVWNFKEDRLVAETQLQRSTVTGTPRGYFRDPVEGLRVVRFSPDGDNVVALVGAKIYILRANDLSSIRTIALTGPPGVIHTFGRAVVTERSRVAAMEPSPEGNIVAVLWVSDLLQGRIDLYDLSSGRRVRSWATPQGWVGLTKNLSWGPDGKSLVVPIPNESPCASPGTLPDVFAFDPGTGEVQHKFTTGLLTEDVATAPGDRVLAVDSDCLGVFKNHHPKLRVFAILTGKRIRELSGRGTRVRYAVSVSADGARCLAFTGRMGVRFDWGDMLPVDKVIDQTFSVWDLTNYRLIVTSQDIPGLRGSELRLSRSGR